MHRSKIIKKRTKNRETLLRNLRKGKARQEDRANFQIIPYPPKFSHMAHMHRLYGDLVVMEQNETLISEISLCNNFKYYKNAQVFDGGSQKVVKYQVESKVDTFEDWRAFVENLEKSEADSMKQWAQPIRAYSERYEAVLKEFQGKISSEREQVLNEINAKSEKAMQTILKTYPCMYIKSQLKDGHIQITEICYSEKYLAEMGYGIDDYTSVMFREGIPLSVPLDGQMGSWIAKMRLEKHLTADPDGHQTPESDSFAIMKNGFLKKLRFKIHYYACYEKGVPGFVIMGVVMARQKPSMSVAKPVEAIKLNPDYVDFMRNREKEQADFMLEFYNVKPEQKYTNLNKVCKIKEVTSPENL